MIRWLETSTPKQRCGGTVRARSLEDTWNVIQPLRSMAGVTRVANVTGLDDVGIPTAIAVRPNARSLSVSQGKGASVLAAKVSALMESLELFHAEEPLVDLRVATVDAMTRTERTVDLARIPKAFREPYPQLRTLWCRGQDVVANETLWVPFGLATMDMTLPFLEGSAVYPPSSNGLASGNTPAEALLHALYELIERDAYSRFFQREPMARQALRVDLDSISDPLCDALLDAMERARLAVAVWDISSSIALPSFACAVLEQEHEPFRAVGIAYGAGTHLDPCIALSRAVTEAAQSRLTRISGGRDSMQPENVSHLQSEASWHDNAQLFTATEPGRPLRTEPASDGDTLEDDIRFVLSRLRACGMDQVVAVDLSREGWPIAVVRAVVPGLEGCVDQPSYRASAPAEGASAQ